MVILKNMKQARQKVVLKKRGRPATGNDPMMSLRIPFGLRAAVERWAACQPDNPARSEAFRRLVEMGLATPGLSRSRSAKSRARATELAAEVIDRKLDPTAPPEEQASRKRRLLKGPKEFRELRRDLIIHRPRASIEASSRGRALFRRSDHRGDARHMGHLGGYSHYGHRQWWAMMKRTK
jgi:hypothetical protein